MSDYAVMMCAFLFLAIEGALDIVKAFFQNDATGAIVYFSIGCGCLYVSYHLWRMF